MSILLHGVQGLRRYMVMIASGMAFPWLLGLTGQRQADPIGDPVHGLAGS